MCTGVESLVDADNIIAQIFGPILPVFKYKDLSEVYEFVLKRYVLWWWWWGEGGSGRYLMMAVISHWRPICTATTVRRSISLCKRYLLVGILFDAPVPVLLLIIPSHLHLTLVITSTSPRPFVHPSSTIIPYYSTGGMIINDSIVHFAYPLPVSDGI